MEFRRSFLRPAKKARVGFHGSTRAVREEPPAPARKRTRALIASLACAAASRRSRQKYQRHPARSEVGGSLLPRVRAPH